MTAERESMTLQEMDAPALGVEERRDEAPGPEPATRGQRRSGSSSQTIDQAQDFLEQAPRYRHFG